MPGLRALFVPASRGKARWIAVVLGTPAGLVGGGALMAFAPAVASGSDAVSTLTDAVAVLHPAPRPAARLAVAATLHAAPGIDHGTDAVAAEVRP